MKTKWNVVKHRFGGYSVERDGKLLQSIFRLKSDALKHMNNLKKTSISIEEKFKKALKKNNYNK